MMTGMSNPDDIRAFVKDSKKKGNRKGTFTNDLNIALRMALFYKKDLDTIFLLPFAQFS